MKTLNFDAVTKEVVEIDVDEVKHKFEVMFTLSETNRTNINDFLTKAIDENKVYTALATPTLAQNTKQIKALTKQNNKMIRLLLNLLDSID